MYSFGRWFGNSPLLILYTKGGQLVSLSRQKRRCMLGLFGAFLSSVHHYSIPSVALSIFIGEILSIFPPTHFHYSSKSLFHGGIG